MIKKIMLDANEQCAITSCSECSAHEDADTPPTCLVFDGKPIDTSAYVHGYPDWCKLEPMAVVDSDAITRNECLCCGSNSIKKVMGGDTLRYAICRSCGVRYFPKID